MNEEEAREELKKHISLVNKDYAISDYCEKCGNIEALGTVLTLLEKKDKIIDEMAKTINEAYFGSGDFEEWFENKICKVQRYEDYTYLEKDIKQHFERTVENGN